MADFVQTDGAALKAIYGLGDNVQINGTAFKIVYSTAADPGAITINAAALKVVYGESLEIQYRVFPVPPPQRLLQSQAGKRKFPIVQ